MSHLTLFHIFLAFCRIISFVIFHCDSRINNIWGVYMTLILVWYLEGSVELGWSWDVCCDSFPEYWWVSKLELLERETAALFFLFIFWCERAYMTEIIFLFSSELLFLWWRDGDKDFEWECILILPGISRVFICYIVDTLEWVEM